MKKAITRTITNTTIRYSLIERDEDGSPIFVELPIEVVQNERLTEESAEKYLKKNVLSKGKRIGSIELSYESTVYEADLDDFLSIARPIITKEEE